MVLLQTVRAGEGPRYIHRPRRGHWLCINLDVLYGYTMEKLNVWPCILVPMQSPCLSAWKKMRVQIFFAYIVSQRLLVITPGLISFMRI